MESRRNEWDRRKERGMNGGGGRRKTSCKGLQMCKEEGGRGEVCPTCIDRGNHLKDTLVKSIQDG